MFTFRGSDLICHFQDHLVCFLPGSLALGTLHGAPSWHLELAEQVIRTCVEMYHTKTGLAPEIIKFDSSSRLYISVSRERHCKYYIIYFRVVYR